MHIRINVKGVSRRREAVVQQVREYPDRPMTAGEFLEETVRQTVRAYNANGTDDGFLKLFSRNGPEEASAGDAGGTEDAGETPEERLDRMAAEGRVKYGRFPDGKKADEKKAVADALSAFADGLVALFADGVRYEEAGEVIPLHEDSEVTFVRLTFLAGRMW